MNLAARKESTVLACEASEVDISMRSVAAITFRAEMAMSAERCAAVRAHERNKCSQEENKVK